MALKYWAHLADGTTRVVHSLGNVIDDIPVIGHHQIPEKIADNYKADDEKAVAENEASTDE